MKVSTAQELVETTVASGQALVTVRQLDATGLQEHLVASGESSAMMPALVGKLTVAPVAAAPVTV
jgi:hypothetical protein